MAKNRTRSFCREASESKRGVCEDFGRDAVAGREAVEDNGRGLPKDDRDRLTEPYMTTRAKGTGLGLAIVKKNMEDHNGEVVLEDRDCGGARVILRFGTTGNFEATIEDFRLDEHSFSTVSASGQIGGH